MKTLFGGVALTAIVALALPAWSQTHTMPGQSPHQNAHGYDGASKPGLSGLPGSKSGPTVTPSGSSMPETKTQPSGDQSGVKGMPGNKSGRTVTPPSGAGR